MPSYRLFLLSAGLCFVACTCSFAQMVAKDGSFTAVDTLSSQSRLLRFARTGAADPKKVLINVLVRESVNREPVMGATVLLRREKPVRMYGKVTDASGSSTLTIAPDVYSVRVQVTGLASFEQSGFLLEPGNTYTLEIALTFPRK